MGLTRRLRCPPGIELWKPRKRIPPRPGGRRGRPGRYQMRDSECDKFLNGFPSRHLEMWDELCRRAAGAPRSAGSTRISEGNSAVGRPGAHADAERPLLRAYSQTLRIVRRRRRRAASSSADQRRGCRPGAVPRGAAILSFEGLGPGLAAFASGPRATTASWRWGRRRIRVTGRLGQRCRGPRGFG